MGLPNAAVALSRAAFEAPLRKKAARTFGGEAVSAADLKDVIDDFAVRGRMLSAEGRNRAHKVRIAANRVLHREHAESLDALNILECSRSVVSELLG
jgi:hypothetical protein